MVTGGVMASESHRKFFASFMARSWFFDGSILKFKPVLSQM